MAYTRAQVRELIRQRCDLENTTAQQDTELNNHINDAAIYVHDFLISTYGSRYDLNFDDFPTVAGTPLYSLSTFSPALYRPISIRLVIDDLEYPLPTFEHAELVAYGTSQSWGPGNLPEYALVLGADSVFTILFNPPPDAVHTVQIGYHKTAPVYTADGDSVTLPHVDLLIMEACIRVKDKEERDASRFMQERQLIQKRIEDWAAPVDAINPAKTIRAASNGRLVWRRDRVF